MTIWSVLYLVVGLLLAGAYEGFARQGSAKWTVGDGAFAVALVVFWPACLVLAIGYGIGEAVGKRE